MNQFFTSGGQSIGASASASVLPMNISAVMLSKSLIQFSVDGWGCVPSLLFGLRPNYSQGNEGNSDLLQPTKVHIVKAMVFPVVMYGCESWTMKKAEC